MGSLIASALAAFVLTAALGPLVIPALKRLKFGQNVRSDGPATHAVKAGTPTMGGVIFLLGFGAAALPFVLNDPQNRAVVLVTLAFGAIGLADDLISIRKKRSLGLKTHQKLLAQIVVSVAFILYWRTLPAYSTVLLVPFFPDIALDLGGLYPMLVCFVFLSAANGANLTDGLDGLAAGVTAFIAAFFAVAAYLAGSPVSPIAGALVGSLLGFLVFNAHPAGVIMGDTGALALGGFVACAAVMLRMPLFLIIVAVIYVLESLSVILQVGYFKLTRKRLFKMAPFHHHFELSGWPETRVVARFYIVTVLGCLIGFWALAGF